MHPVAALLPLGEEGPLSSLGWTARPRGSESGLKRRTSRPGISPPSRKPVPPGSLRLSLEKRRRARQGALGWPRARICE